MNEAGIDIQSQALGGAQGTSQRKGRKDYKSQRDCGHKNLLSRAHRGSQKLEQQSGSLEYFLKTKSHISWAGHKLVSHPMVALNFF